MINYFEKKNQKNMNNTTYLMNLYSNRDMGLRSYIL